MTEVAARPEADSELADLAAGAGLARVRAVAWRDMDDPEAGGSELHAHEVLRRFAAAGLDVSLRTSAVPGSPAESWRDGYRLERRDGRYTVFAQVARELRRSPAADGAGLVEIWNGMPFLTPVFAPRVPKVVILHHVHAEMWRMVLPPALGLLGEGFERKVAPLAYRRTRIVTGARSSGEEIVSMLGIPEEMVTVVPNGIDPCFTPGGERASRPLVVAVARLVPVKRLELLVDAVAHLRGAHPQLEAVIVGEGYTRAQLEEHVRRRGAGGFVSLPGRLGSAELVALYRRAWVLVSMSAREGWGLTITEAAACGTPAVATRIAGHLDSIAEGVTGFLAEPGDELAGRLDQVLSDELLRRRLGDAAAVRARSFTWDLTARGLLEALAGEVRAARDERARRGRRPRARAAPPM